MPWRLSPRKTPRMYKQLSQLPLWLPLWLQSRSHSRSLFATALAATLSVTAAVAVPVARAQAAPPAATQATSTPGSSSQNAQLSALQQQGLTALHANQPQQALKAFQQMLALDPQSASANLLAATAELQLYQPQPALQYALKAQALEPDNWKVHTSLVTAYTMAGDIAHRDAEVNILRKDHDDPKLPEAQQTSGFLLDLFEVGRFHVEAVEYFHPLGRYNTYFRFIIRNAAGARLWTIEVNSDSLNQSSWAASYPREAKQGQRQFQIESEPGDHQVEYRNFSGAPSYDYIKPQIVKILTAQAKPFPDEASATP
jgi:tetratricopeptide (TPR) repeat protein